MATLHKFSLKKVVNYKGHEGEPLSQADVYYDGKKIGFWSMGDFGGEDNFDFDYSYLKTIKETWDGWKKENLGYSLELVGAMFFGELLTLMDTEKFFKKMVKTGYEIVIQVNGLYYTACYGVKATANLEKATEHCLEQFDKQFPFMDGYPRNVKVFKDISEFTVV